MSHGLLSPSSVNARLIIFFLLVNFKKEKKKREPYLDHKNSKNYKTGTHTHTHTYTHKKSRQYKRIPVSINDNIEQKQYILCQTSSTGLRHPSSNHCHS